MDFANGGDLFFHLKREYYFSEERCRLIAAEITLAFEALHKEDIIYRFDFYICAYQTISFIRDLKPENVLLSADGILTPEFLFISFISLTGHVCLTDFGLSKQNINTKQMTATFCGTPEYIGLIDSFQVSYLYHPFTAPEMILNKPYGKPVDWWALGTFLYEILTGMVCSFTIFFQYFYLLLITLFLLQICILFGNTASIL